MFEKKVTQRVILRCVAGLQRSASATLLSCVIGEGLPGLVNANHYFNTCYIDLSGNRQNGGKDAQPAWIQQPAFTLRTLSTELSDVHQQKPPNVDLSLVQSFPMAERPAPQFRAEAYNFTNTAYFGAPSTARTSSAFGRESHAYTNGPRTEQLTLSVLVRRA